MSQTTGGRRNSEPSQNQSQMGSSRQLDAHRIHSHRVESQVSNESVRRRTDDDWRQRAFSLTETEANGLREGGKNIPNQIRYNQQRTGGTWNHSHRPGGNRRHNGQSAIKTSSSHDKHFRHRSSLEQFSSLQKEGQPVFYGHAESRETNINNHLQPDSIQQSFLVNTSPPRGRI